MTSIDVTSAEKKTSIGENLRGFWSIEMQRLCFDHIKRGLQIGSLFGTFFVFPYTIYKDLKNLKALNFRRILNKQAAALTIGIGLSMAWMGIKYFTWSNR